jgi:hypothetical protein
MNCCYYQFEFFEKGFQAKYDKDNNATNQYIPFTQIITIRSEYIYDEKLIVVTIILKDSIKYSYTFKGKDQGEDFYKKIISYLS